MTCISAQSIPILFHRMANECKHSQEAVCAYLFIFDKNAEIYQITYYIFELNKSSF